VIVVEVEVVLVVVVVGAAATGVGVLPPPPQAGAARRTATANARSSARLTGDPARPDHSLLFIREPPEGMGIVYPQHTEWSRRDYQLGCHYG
jgi:hypothetical protein